MTDREQQNKHFVPRLISENTDLNIEIARAKQTVAKQLADLAATLLRTMVQSPTAAPIMPNVLGLVAAQDRLASLTGSHLDQEEEKRALGLAEVGLPSRDTDTGCREWEYAVGIEQILRGAIRLAAHQVLQERESFGGKYSTQAIEQGIELILRARRGPQSKRKRRAPAIRARRDSLPLSAIEASATSLLEFA